jgi:hypothetical protein
VFHNVNWKTNSLDIYLVFRVRQSTNHESVKGTFFYRWDQTQIMCGKGKCLSLMGVTARIISRFFIEFGVWNFGQHKSVTGTAKQKYVVC